MMSRRSLQTVIPLRFEEECVQRAKTDTFKSKRKEHHFYFYCTYNTGTQEPIFWSFYSCCSYYCVGIQMNHTSMSVHQYAQWLHRTAHASVFSSTYSPELGSVKMFLWQKRQSWMVLWWSYVACKNNAGSQVNNCYIRGLTYDAYTFCIVLEILWWLIT